MPPLKNAKHEQFCHELLRNPTQKDAYLATVPNVTPATATVQSSRLLSNSNVKERFYELLRGSGIDLPHICNRYGRWLNDDRSPVQSWDAVKTGLKIYGVIDDDEKSSNNFTSVNISVNVIKAST